MKSALEKHIDQERERIWSAIEAKRGYWDAGIGVEEELREIVWYNGGKDGQWNQDIRADKEEA